MLKAISSGWLLKCRKAFTKLSSTVIIVVALQLYKKEINKKIEKTKTTVNCINALLFKEIK